MSIRKMIAQKIQSLREQIAVWDNPKASSEEKGKVLAALVGNDPSFWGSVAKLATTPAKKKNKLTATVSPLEVVQMEAVTAKPAPIAAAPAPKPTPAKPVKATAPPRTLSLKVGGGDFAAKLVGAAAQIGLEDHTILGKWRKAMTEETRGYQAWKACRELNAVALSEKVIKTDSDWALLARKMKGNLFFTDARGVGNFIDQCPKAVVTDLLLGEGGLWITVEKIRGEEISHPAAPARIGFVIDMCTMVGSPAKELMTNAKHAVNRMRQLGVLEEDHWLVQKVAEMKAAKQAAKKAELAEKANEETPSGAEVDRKIDAVQEVAEAVSMSVN